MCCPCNSCFKFDESRSPPLAEDGRLLRQSETKKKFSDGGCEVIGNEWKPNYDPNLVWQPLWSGSSTGDVTGRGGGATMKFPSGSSPSSMGEVRSPQQRFPFVSFGFAATPTTTTTLTSDIYDEDDLEVRFTSVASQLPRDESRIRNLLSDPRLDALLWIYKKLQTMHPWECQPLADNALQVSDQICDFLGASMAYDDPDAAELFSILRMSHIRAILDAHDQIATRAFESPAIDLFIPPPDENEITIKVVQLVKSNEPLGITICRDDVTGDMVISRVLLGGAAHRSGLIHVSDILLEINGVSMQGCQPDAAVGVLARTCHDGAVTLKLAPPNGRLDDENDNVEHFHEPVITVRALFDYQPHSGDDMGIPCIEAALPFRRGEVLHVVSQRDLHWWQARKHGQQLSPARLIPSPLHYQRFVAEKRDLVTQRKKRVGASVDALLDESHNNSSDDSSSILPPQLRRFRDFAPIARSRPKKVKKAMYRIEDNEDYDREALPAYEEVSLVDAKKLQSRPIVLLGPPGVGRNELKRRLIATNPLLFRSTIPHTSRPPRPWEIPGEDYIFEPRDLMEQDVRFGKFMEYGRFNGHIYGTKLDTVRAVIREGGIAVLTPHPQALKMLRTREFKPFITFIKPPTFEVFKKTRQRMGAKSPFDAHFSRGFTDDEVREILYLAHKMEFLYGHFFDSVIVNEDLGMAFTQLMTLVHAMRTQPQWIPIQWTIGDD